ncbi:hypothetical protein ZIOFF_073838 [Zingiber officinale]|uniref:Uncharacterized protein n=1 Tax=Zingiber officinale TaxID=94328 RepID=A0A8J5EAJ3_ZINOF|nr:hypothetical protein ZIOFF_073838 [Zingiber officinale]
MEEEGRFRLVALLLVRCTKRAASGIILVSQDGSGYPTTVQAAVDRVLVDNNNRGEVSCPIHKDLHYQDFNGQQVGTYNSATVAVDSDYFRANAITFQEIHHAFVSYSSIHDSYRRGGGGDGKAKPHLLSLVLQFSHRTMKQAAAAAGRYKLWALAAILLLALWSVLTGTVTIKRFSRRPSDDDLGGPDFDDLDVLVRPRPLCFLLNHPLAAPQ